MKSLYNVVAIKDRKIQGADGKTFIADEGYVVHNSFQTAATPQEAVERVKSYYMTPWTKYDRIEVKFASDVS